MLANTDFNPTPQVLANIPNAGQIVQAPPMPIPTEPKPLASTGNYTVPKTGIVAAVNSYDPEDDSEFEPVLLQDEDLLDASNYRGISHHHADFSNYMGTDIEAVAPNFAAILKKASESGVLHVPTRILTNQVYHLHLTETQPSSYTGDDYSNFDGINDGDLQRHQEFFESLSPGEQEVYSDFLGINFKKIGKAIGGAVKGIGKAVGGAGKPVGKVGKWTGKTIGKGAKLIGKGVVAGVKLGAKVLASQAGLDNVTDQSNGVVMPTNWGQGPQGGGYNPDWNPQLGEDQDYEPDLSDQNSFDIADLRDAQDDALMRAQARDAVAEALGPDPEPKTNIWLWVALAAFLGFGFYLVKSHKLKV